MAKRSQSKKLFSRDNYKLREFVLTPYCIKYFEVSGGIAYVEDSVSTSWSIMYIVAGTAIERDDWISLVRYYSKERGAIFLPKYHPGIWKKPGRHSCCDDINRRSMGCQATIEPGLPILIEEHQLPRRSSSSANTAHNNASSSTSTTNSGGSVTSNPTSVNSPSNSMPTAVVAQLQHCF
ncbi:unnamed protein product [Protopolystoma xenopodis]|uniref:PH domain-containing protein n=1 Tax=Protopolystoma xenopodis TaxID=117903 RepID=A0A3S5CP74_9PLAT|nr:unnamed protein product [Protopolystoma xenopodis]